MAYGTVNADVIGTSVANSNLGAGNATRFKNRIINGDMRIDQRNAGASGTATGVYTVDRWTYQGSQASKGTWGQNLGSVTPPVGFVNYLGFSSSSAYTVGTSEFFMFGQIIEANNIADWNWGTANAKTVTLSFQVYSSLTGNFGGSFQNSAQNYSYPFTYSIPVANTWTTISVTISGPTAGTWLTGNNAGVKVWFGFGVGATVSGTAGSWSANGYFSATGATSVVGTSGATFYITGVQLEVGSSATGFEYVDYTTQLSMCQRYYEVVTVGSAGLALVSSLFVGTQYILNLFFKVTKRTQPTTGLGSGSSWVNTTPVPSSISVDNIYYANASSYFYLSGTSNTTAIYLSSEL
jgi:hypothetical protein